MKKILFLSLGLGFLTPQLVFSASTLDIYPRPHDISEYGKKFELGPVRLSGEKKVDKDAIALLQTFITVDSTVNYPIIFEEGKGLPRIKQISGAYRLEANPNGIYIHAFDGRGTFYAVQTLKQLLADDKMIKPFEILDYPDVEFRGTVEGFYGQPWGFEGRKSQIEFYGRNKMNTYIYGPKDDPFHGFSNRWREPYPEKEGAKLKELVDIAHQNKVDFVWAVHPGRDIKWDTDSDIIACINKFEMMYDLGVRSFAIFFDDIGGEGARPEMQVKLLNRVNRDFVRKKGDVTPLIMCPTQYNQSWSSGKYLDILGNDLDKDVAIMWTGRSVCTDITKESVEWVNNRIKRKAYIWWNWPVSDYCRTQLLIGTSYGNSKENKNLVSGFTSNPMDKPEASQIALFPLADYCWNMDDYQSDLSWKAGIKKMFPKCAEAMQTFANHNSDQGPSGHGYRRDESVEMKPFIDAYKKAKKEKQFDRIAHDALTKEFVAIEKSAQILRKELANTRLWNEIECWVEAFEGLGVAGQAVMSFDVNPNQAQLEKALIGFDMMDEAFNAQKLKTSNDPWAQGCRVATAQMTPFIKELLKDDIVNYYENFTGKKPSGIASSMQYKGFSNSPHLKNPQAERKNQFVELKRIMEMITLQPKEFIGLELPEGIHANYFHLKYEGGDLPKNVQIQISKDGRDWNNFGTRNSQTEMQNGIDIKKEIRFVRLINTSDKPVEFKINLFKFDIPADSQVNSIDAATDGDFFTSFSPTEAFQYPKPKSSKIQVFGNGKYKVTIGENHFSIVPEKDAKIKEILIQK